MNNVTDRFDLSNFSLEELDNLLTEMDNLICGGVINWDSPFINPWMEANGFPQDRRLIVVSTAYAQQMSLSIAKELRRRISQ